MLPLQYVLALQYVLPLQYVFQAGQNPKLWKASERVQRVREQVMQRLGWKTMSTSDLLTLYKTCGYLMLTEPRFERGQPSEPALCGVFSGTDLGALEYYFDLKKYYGFGYGLPVNSQLARPLLQLIQEEWAQQQHKGSYRFGHAGEQPSEHAASD